MNRIRILLVAALLGTVVLTSAATPVSAAEEPNVGCGGPVVEACFPVCVTDPCPGYVCVHRVVEICREL